MNKAAAEELAAALELSAEVAEAVVRYREANGRFKTPDDLVLTLTSEVILPKI